VSSLTPYWVLPKSTMGIHFGLCIYSILKHGNCGTKS